MIKTKLVILQTHPIQYLVPLYRALARNDSLSVLVLYLTDSGARPYHDPSFGRIVDWKLPLLEGYKTTILKPSATISELDSWSRHDERLLELVAKESPDWIWLHGYASRMNWLTLLWAIRNRVKIAYTSDTNIQIQKKNVRSVFKAPLLRFFFHHVSSFFSTSVSNQAYLLRHGANPISIYHCPFPVEYTRFSQGQVECKIYDFVWAGKLVDQKRPLDFVKALRGLRDRGHRTFHASLIGDGGLMDAILKHGDDLINAGILKCQGFVNYAEMPAQLGAGKIFVFTAKNENYGLVATEAAATGAALIVADKIGCVGPDSSAQPGFNTLTYPTGDIEALTDAMEKVLTDPILRSRMQAQSIRIGKQHDVENVAQIISSVLASD